MTIHSTSVTASRSHLPRFPLAILCLAILSACGGGGGGESTAGGSVIGDAIAQVPASVPITWSTAVAENQTFRVSGPTVVRYGVGDKWIQRTLTGTINCSNSFFGSDPEVGAIKSCQVLSGDVINSSPAPVASAPAPAPAPAPQPAPAPATGQTSRTIVAQLEATRLSGPAPLAVQFDATGTTSSLAIQHPFHHVRYSFNFGDDRGLTWPISGLPKNVQTGGPLSAYVFDRPGIYQVRVRATDQAGDYSERSISVEVLDPNAVYSGTGTICVSAAANFSDCPNGASRVTVLPSSASFSSRRVLLRRGEIFGSINIPHGSQNVQVGAFGTGAKPRVSSVLVGELRAPSPAFPRDISVIDLNILQRFEQFVTMSRLLLYRNTFEVPTGEVPVAQINIASALSYMVQHGSLAASQYIQPREIFVVENQLSGSTSNPFMNMAGEGSRFVILGNDMGAAQQHTIRIWAMHKGYISHNALRGRSSDGIRHVLKLHSGGLGDYNDNYAISRSTWASRQIVIANNRLGDATDNNSWTGVAGPQNAGPNSREGLEDVVLEGNVFHRGPNTNTELVLMGRRMTSRGNTRADGGSVNINQPQNAYQLLPAEWVGPFYYQ